MSGTGAEQPDWDRLLTAASRLQNILPDAVLVGGTAAALHAGHRTSGDTDHVLPDLRECFDLVLADLESVAGWKTARVRPPVLILGSLDGIETGVPQLIRSEPLETIVIERHGVSVTVPTVAEILRIKAVLILRRNATRDYLEFAALANRLSPADCVQAMNTFDRLYPQDSGQSATQQLLAQLSNPLPYDLDEREPASYRELVPALADWANVRRICANSAQILFDGLCSAPHASPPTEQEARKLEDPFAIPDPFEPPSPW